MESPLSLVPLALGVGLLLGGAELFSEAAVDTARALRVTTIAIGLLLAGAEPEELFTAAIAAGKQAPGIAIGDAVGTNVTIIGLALGLGAMIAPIAVERAALRHGLITLVVALPATFLLMRGSIGRAEGLLLGCFYGGYVWYVVRHERISIQTDEGTLENLAREPGAPAKSPAWRFISLILLGLVMMASGGHFTVEGAVAVAAWAGLSETAIGLTLVALATSGEMLVLSIVPVLKGHPELTVGGIIGSYASNVTLTLGAAAVVAPLSVDQEPVLVSIVFMLGLLVLLLLLVSRGRLGRGSGLALLAIYGLFVALTLRS